MAEVTRSGPAATSRMAAEIAEQPAAVEQTLAALLPRRPAIARLAAGRRHVLLVARGSSDNAAVYGRYLVETHTRMSAALAAPSIATHYVVERDLSDTLVVSLSQSGETAEIVRTQAWATACGAVTIAITNVPDSPLARDADLALTTEAGVESAVPATKSYTTQLVAVAAVVSALSTDGDGLEAALHRAPAEMADLLARTPTAAAGDLLAGAESVLVTARGLCLGTALEVALKLEETCLRPVRGLSYADLRHGPIAVAGPGVVAVLVAAGDGPLLAGMTELATDLRVRGARVLGLGGDAAFRARCDMGLPGPALPEAVAPVALVVPAQKVIEALARRLGLDPDAPTGLSKVTRTDKVRDP